MIEPINNYVIVKPIEETMKGNLVMIASPEDRAGEGEVVAIGRNVFQIRVKDRVIFRKASPDSFEYENQIYLVLKEEEIMAKVQKTE